MLLYITELTNFITCQIDKQYINYIYHEFQLFNLLILLKTKLPLKV